MASCSGRMPEWSAEEHRRPTNCMVTYKYYFYTFFKVIFDTIDLKEK